VGEVVLVVGEFADLGLPPTLEERVAFGVEEVDLAAPGATIGSSHTLVS